MAFASSLFCSSKFLEHTHTLTKCLTVLACSDNTKDVRTPSVRFFGSFYPNVRIFFLCQNISWRYRRGRKKNSVQQKKKHNTCFFFFLLGAVFCPPPQAPPSPPASPAATNNRPRTP